MEYLIFLAFFASIGYTFWRSRPGTRLRFHYFPASFQREYQGIQLYYSLYPKLTRDYQKEFQWRVFYFLYTTKIEFRQFEEYTQGDRDKIRHLLGSLAAQMTLFLPADCFTLIHTILVYPKAYFSKYSNQYHKGETNPGAGVIVLSWTGISEGIQSSNDGLNLILHEYAHALWIEHQVARYTIFDEVAAERFRKEAMKELADAGGKENHFFRDYGLTNLHEFIAVATENFFERPDKLKQNLPRIYEAMVDVFKQDPTGIR